MMSSRTRNRALVIASIVALVAIFVVSVSPAGARMVAPRSQCDGQQNIKAPEPQQEDAMRCLIDYARSQVGLRHVGTDRSLERAAGRKAGDVIRCGLSHTACGRPADAYARKFGYMSASSWSWGENLAWGRGKLGTARNILKAWLNSPPHRATMLTGSFNDLGLGLKRGSFGGHANASIWALQLGCHGC